MIRSKAGASGGELVRVQADPVPPQAFPNDMDALFDHVRADERERILVSLRGVHRSLAAEHDPELVAEIMRRIVDAISTSAPLTHMRAIEAQAPRGRHAAPEPEPEAQPTPDDGELQRRPMPPAPKVVAMTPVAPVHQMSDTNPPVVNGSPVVATGVALKPAKVKKPFLPWRSPN